MVAKPGDQLQIKGLDWPDRDLGRAGRSDGARREGDAPNAPCAGYTPATVNITENDQ